MNAAEIMELARECAELAADCAMDDPEMYRDAGEAAFRLKRTAEILEGET